MTKYEKDPSLYVIITVVSFIIIVFITLVHIGSTTEVHPNGYDRIAEAVEEHPQLKPLVTKHYEDGIISSSEYHDIINQYKKLKNEQSKKYFDEVVQ